MSILTMSPYHHHQRHADFRQELPWLDHRPEPVFRLRNEPERIALPSIRQAFPELQLDVQRDGAIRTPPSAMSPARGQFYGTLTSPDYVHSPNQRKRRRSSLVQEGEPNRINQIPRLCASPRRSAMSQPQSPAVPTSSAFTSWSSSKRTSPYLGHSTLPSINHPVNPETHERKEARPRLPSLLLNLEQHTSDSRRIHAHAGEEYLPESARRVELGPNSHTGPDAATLGHRAVNFAYGYHHPNRVQSLSVGSVHPLDRTPFSPISYGTEAHDTFMRAGEFGMGMNGDGKQRKRRGNLPKETTDKLRTWFVAHLHHPYPTEDEKQDLMRQTGLQMNQISNWFINARRRQLPTMISNARAESNAMNGRTGEKVLSSPEEIEFEHERKQRSDSEGSSYDEMETQPPIKSRRPTKVKRGSI
ncbi:hypothetical protein F5Y18DRAFT_441097 [Xylariaceae sp. FL1019]|nr:hypothetical protein F5Y18DRAFT_441097 [Xylariaceae sp. FL1019]